LYGWHWHFCTVSRVLGSMECSCSIRGTLCLCLDKISQLQVSFVSHTRQHNLAPKEESRPTFKNDSRYQGIEQGQAKAPPAPPPKQQI
jgi:hypothetical protein